MTEAGTDQDIHTSSTQTLSSSHENCEWKHYLEINDEEMLRFYFVGNKPDMLLKKTEHRYIAYKTAGKIALPFIQTEMYDRKYMSLPINQVLASMNKLLRCMDDEMSKKGKEHDIQPTETDFLKKALLIIRPTYAPEPFYAFGIEVICVKNMETIYSLEDLPVKGFLQREDVEISPNQTELLKFLWTILNEKPPTKNSNTNSHILSTFVSTIFDSKTGKLTKFWKQEKAKYFHDNKLVEDVCVFLESFIYEQTHLTNNFKDMDLCMFLLTVLKDLDFISESSTKTHVRLGRTKNFEQFRHTSSGSTTKGQQITTDLEMFDYIFDADMEEDELSDLKQVFTILIFQLKGLIQRNDSSWMPPCMHNDCTNNFISSVEMESALLWQVKEQLLTTAMNTDFKIEEETIVLQGGMIVCNDKVRSVVLAMDFYCYNGMKENECARDSLEWILAHSLDGSKMWARLYVDANEYHILDVITQAKYTYANFCQAL